MGVLMCDVCVCISTYWCVLLVHVCVSVCVCLTHSSTTTTSLRGRSMFLDRSGGGNVGGRCCGVRVCVRSRARVRVCVSVCEEAADPRAVGPGLGGVARVAASQPIKRASSKPA